MEFFIPSNTSQISFTLLSALAYFAFIDSNLLDVFDCYAVYRAVENDAEYRLLGYTKKTEFLDGEFQQGNKSRLTYKVTALDKTRKGESKGAVAFLSPATRLEKERYQHIIRQMNLYG